MAGTLLRAGWEEREVAEFLEAAARAADDEEWMSRKITGFTTRRKLDKDEPATGRQRLGEIIGAEVVNRACEWLGIESNRTWSPRLGRQGVPWPEPLAEKAFYGLAGDIVRAIEPKSEADPAGLLGQFLGGFGNLIGRNAYFAVSATRHHPNLYIGLVGRTSKSRKGTAFNEIFRPLKDADPYWAQERVMHGGLGSGEGLIYAVRDPHKTNYPHRKHLNQKLPMRPFQRSSTGNSEGRRRKTLELKTSGFSFLKPNLRQSSVSWAA